jgi:hypothetical protein
MFPHRCQARSISVTFLLVNVIGRALLTTGMNGGRQIVDAHQLHDRAAIPSRASAVSSPAAEAQLDAACGKPNGLPAGLTLDRRCPRAPACRRKLEMSPGAQSTNGTPPSWQTHLYETACQPKAGVRTRGSRAEAGLDPRAGAAPMGHDADEGVS